MSQTTKSRKSKKDFPLTARTDGRWQKKVAGKTYYFRGTRREALEEWLRVKDDLYAGHDPRDRTSALTLRELFNRFLTVKKHAVENGELTQKSWNDYKVICDKIRGVFGLTQTIESLRSEDFAKLRREFSRGCALVTLNGYITRARVVFRFAEDHDLIEGRVKGLMAFKKPSKSDLRKEQNRNRAVNGERMFSPDEVHRVLGEAAPQMKAMILLAANTGMGNMDVAELQPCHIHAGWLDYPRPKTGIARRAKLWQETLEAIDSAGGLPFRTKYGRPWVDRKTTDNAIAKEMRKLLNRCGIDRRGVGFYGLRHGFETVASECKDQPAVDLCMGHGDDSMAGVYRERISDERLEAIANHVHAWLFAVTEKLD